MLPQPTEEQIAGTLMLMRKFTPEDQLNCGSCGYPSCREKAIAVCQGLAEVDMCLPYLVEELETTLTKLQQSHQELATTQNRLVQTERLASMGQISAGVAHEINNPLSTILLYSHMLLKQHQTQDPENEDIQMIVNEATRCRYIMRGLLDFARQSRVVKALTDLGTLIREVVANLSLKAAGHGHHGVLRDPGRAAPAHAGRGADPADAHQPGAERRGLHPGGGGGDGQRGDRRLRRLGHPARQGHRRRHAAGGASSSCSPPSSPPSSWARARAWGWPSSTGW